MNSFVSARTTMFAVLTSAALLGGCREDKRTAGVDTGITRDSLLTVIGKGAPGIDSLPNVYQRERYLIGGQNYEIMFFSPTGQHAYVGTPKDTIPWQKLTPIAMIDSRVVGKGWEYLDSLYTANKIPLKQR